MGTQAGTFITELAAKHRVIVIGGLAVIAHGYNRPTKDADVWLDPLESPMSWADAVQSTCDLFADLSIHTLPGWRRIEGTDVATAAEEVGMVRVMGLDCPLDIIVTKLNTGRDKDLDDSRHLESVIRQRYRQLLPNASLEAVKQMFDRFLDWEVCDVALSNPDSAVRQYTMDCLRDMAAEGDPFAQALLEEREIPYSNP